MTALPDSPPLSDAQAVGQKMMLAFAGHTPSPEILATLARQHVGGLTLFRALNIGDPAQVRALTAALQAAAAAAGQPPLLIAADQEGGTLVALAGTTPFPGNMALGASRSPELARRLGWALGRELAALGVNVNYAPVCDVNCNPANPVVGPRSFGDSPGLVAELGAALIGGLQAAGVAATAKHFPGHGDTANDSHHGTPVLRHDMERLRRVELPPFAAAVEAGVRLIMTAHVALPALTGSRTLPATLSPLLLRGLLRDGLGFDGVIISDALDMHAIRQGPGLALDALAATCAGVDLLLMGANATDHTVVYEALVQAVERELLGGHALHTSARRILALKAWVGQHEQPPLETVGCAEHLALAAEIATQAVTLVRDTAQQLPLRLPSTARVAAILPRPEDLTPADTSSYEVPQLAAALRPYHPTVDEFTIPLDPDSATIAALRDQVRDYDLIIVGTINATMYPGQAALMQALQAAGQPLIAVALRLPYDLAAYPAVPTYLCTYSVQPPSLAALAAALWGAAPISGRLPVAIPDLYPSGYGLTAGQP